MIGIYPTMKLAEARKRAIEAKEQAKQGINPSQYKKRQQEGNQVLTFAMVAKDWLQHKQANISTSRMKRLDVFIDSYVLPWLGDVDIKAITGARVLKMIRAIEKIENSRTGKPMQTLAPLAVQCVGQIVKHARILGVADCVIDTREIMGMLSKYVTKHHPHIRIEDIGQLLADIEGFNVTEINKIAIKLIMLLVPRSSAFLLSKWEDVDMDNKVLTIKSENQKGGLLAKQSGELEHKIPLPTQAISLLNTLRQLTGWAPNKYIIPSREGGHKRTAAPTLSRILRRNGYQGKQDIHGFRGLFSTWANENYPEKFTIVELILSHKIGNSVSQAYNHAGYMKQKAELLQAWGDYLESRGLKTNI